MAHPVLAPDLATLRDLYAVRDLVARVQQDLFTRAQATKHLRGSDIAGFLIYKGLAS